MLLLHGEIMTLEVVLNTLFEADLKWMIVFIIKKKIYWRHEIGDWEMF